MRTGGESYIYIYSACLIKRAKETKFLPCCEPQFTFLFVSAVDDLRDATVALGKCQDMKKRSWLPSWPWFPAGCLATIKMPRRSRSQKSILHLFLPDCSEPPSSSDFRCLINTTTSSAESNSPMTWWKLQPHRQVCSTASCVWPRSSYSWTLLSTRLHSTSTSLCLFLGKLKSGNWALEKYSIAF